MAELYLDSGESIVLTTHKVSVSYVSYDIILTSRRLILVESGYARFEPWAIPFLNIESVSAGKIATGEPVITLSTRDPDSTASPEQVNLIFSQEHGERRKRERDEWLRKLMGYIVSERQQAAGAEIPLVDTVQTIFPDGATPRPIDIVLPHKTVGGHSNEPDEIVVIPDQPDPPDAPEGGSRLQDSVHTANPEKKEPVDLPWDQAELRKTPAHDMPVIETPPADPETERDPRETIIRATEPVGEHPDDPKEKAEVADLFTRAALAIQESGDVSNVRTSPATLARSITDTPAGEEPAALQKEERGLWETPPPGTMVPPASEGKEPPAAETAQESPTTPPPPSRDWRQAAIAVTAIIIVTLAVMVGAFFFVHYGTEQNGVSDGSVTIPAPTVQPTPDSTVQPTPDSTVQPTPGSPQVIIPSGGVWVQVEYNGTFMGDVGNPGFLQHVGGSGNKFYKVGNSDGFVQVSLQKLDYSGATLEVRIYRDGTMIYNRSVRTPKGEIQFLVNSRTGEPPGVTPAA